MPYVIRKWNSVRPCGGGFLYFNGSGWSVDRRCAVRFDQRFARWALKAIRRAGIHKPYCPEKCPVGNPEACVVRLRKPKRHACTKTCVRPFSLTPWIWLRGYARGRAG